LAPIAEMGKKVRRPRLREFLHKVCISQNLSKNKCTYPMTKTQRKSNNIEDPRIAKEWKKIK
jgi:hypothetical protein